jgi:hypothetical protein
VLDMDVPVPAGPTDGLRLGGVPWKTWVEERRRPVIIAAFAAAALLGVLIGLVTAPSGNARVTTTNTTAAAPARSPQVPVLANRSVGAAVNLKVDDNLRPALQWASADAALAAAGKPTLSSVYLASGAAAAQGASGSAALLTADQITVAKPLYYGIVQGATAGADVYWAVALTQTSNTAISMPSLHVWEREGSGPWTVVAAGPGACAKIPTSLYTAWEGRPALCDGSS